MPGTLLSIGLICAWPFYRATNASQWAIHMLDVGHGLAMVIERQGHAVLYDTGNAWQGGDSAKQTIIPWLRWHHLRPEGIILSHEHLDHRGGLNSLLDTWPDLTVRSSLGWTDHLPCERGQQWRWQGLTFTVHWPLPGHTRQGNNRSCVVNISDGHHSILLTGDIEASAELAMLKQYWQHLRADIIQVPHHGSKTSSTPLPAARVVARYGSCSANFDYF